MYFGSPSRCTPAYGFLLLTGQVIPYLRMIRWTHLRLTLVPLWRNIQSRIWRDAFLKPRALKASITRSLSSRSRSSRLARASAVAHHL